MALTIAKREKDADGRGEHITFKGKSSRALKFAELEKKYKGHAYIQNGKICIYRRIKK